MDFDHILKWELKAGSHKFPGPAGGTCINEAAIIAAGFKYKPVKSWRDCPPCFSPALAQFAIAVNDTMPDAKRKVLMPLVTRLAGSADEPWVEEARLRFISDQLRKAGVSEAIRGAKEWSMSRDVAFAAAQAAEEKLKAFVGEIDNFDPKYDPIGDIAITLCEALFYLMKMGSERPIRLPPKFLRLSASDLLCTPICETVNYDVVFVDGAYFPGVAALALERAFQIGRRAPEADTAKINKVVERLERAKEAA